MMMISNRRKMNSVERPKITFSKSEGGDSKARSTNAKTGVTARLELTRIAQAPRKYERTNKLLIK
jgi:hypothetical protein